jgi:hypothetical protein
MLHNHTPDATRGPSRLKNVAAWQIFKSELARVIGVGLILRRSLDLIN